MTSGELSHIFHLVKNEPDEGDDVEKRGCPKSSSQDYSQQRLVVIITDWTSLGKNAE